MGELLVPMREICDLLGSGAKHTAIGRDKPQVREEAGLAMHKVEIRPDVWMAYEDHWFGPPWTSRKPW